ncbi:MAG TPA: hypothetical protein VD769_09380 [Gaiellaceae bacterium]|nr:hypothetical protein [Gaiellaceae bacterium]
MARTAMLAFAVMALMAGPAQGSAPAGTAAYEVIVVPGLTLDRLQAVQGEGAVGLLNPGAGPETSADLALASLRRGEVRNSLRGGAPSGPELVDTRYGPLLSGEGPAIYVGLPDGGLEPNDERYPILVVGPGYGGLLTSDSTRIPGLVSIADVAPTALGQDGALGSEPAGDAVAELRDLNARINDNNATRLPATIVVCALVLALVWLAPAAAVPGFAAALLANLALGVAGVSGFWAVVTALVVAVAVGGPLLAWALRPPLALGLFLAGVLGAYLVALGLDGPSVALSPFGPTQNSRYFGLSNLLETMLLVPALAGAALLYAALGWAAFAGTGLLAFVAVAGNRFGADGGGAIVLAAGLAVLAVLLAGRGRRALAVAVGASLALALGLIGLDAATGGSSHVTSALEGGPVGLGGDLVERVELSWERATASVWAGLAVLVLLAAFAFLVVQILRRPEPLAELAVPLSLAAALAVSLVVNDSPTDVLLVGTTGLAAAGAGMLRAPWPGSPRSSSLSPLWSPLQGAADPRTLRRRPRP